MGLQQDIRSLLSHASEKPGFVSLESLEGCLTEQKVKDHINSINISISPEELKAIFTMPRLFAILVLLGSEKATVALMEEIEDDTFFYCAEEVPSKVGDNDQRAQFSELQSQFPPMLSCRDPPQEFPDSFRPPFTDELQKGPSGSYGIVRKVKIAGGHLPGHSSSEWMAWKRIETRHLPDDFVREVKTLKARPHKHLISLVACYSTPAGQSYQSQDPALHLIFPWADMDMSDWMRPHDAQPPDHLKGPEEPQRRKEYLYEAIMSLISAVTYLHGEINGTFTSHHDLKPQNILLFGKQWRICDFGMTRLRSLGEGSQTERILGSYAYHPPEYEEKKTVKRHGRSFDIWSLGCIFVELAVLIVYGWESKRLEAFEKERDKNRDRLRARGSNDVSFHNNMPVVRRWMSTMAREDGSRNFMYLMDTVAKMLSMDRDHRPYSWEVEIYLYEQFHPDELGHERRKRIEDRIQTPTKASSHEPLVRAIAEKNWVLVRCLEEKGWTLGSSSGKGRYINHSKKTPDNVVDLFQNFKLSAFQIVEVFKQACDDQGYDLSKIPAKRRDILAERFAAKFDSSPRTFWEIKHILEPRHPVNSIKIFTEEHDVDQADGDQNTALFWASWGNDAITVDILLRYGAHLDPVNKLSETPLMVASKLGHPDVVRRLLVEPLNINHRCAGGRTSLSYAAQFGRPRVAQLLLECSADPDIPGGWGRTPLSWAAEFGRKRIVNLLMNREADPLRADRDGRTPLTHAVAAYRHREWKGESGDHLRDYEDIIRMLKERDVVNQDAVLEALKQRKEKDPRPA